MKEILEIKYNDTVIFRDMLIASDIPFDKDNITIYNSICDAYNIMFGSLYIFDCLDFEAAGYPIDKLSFEVKKDMGEKHLICNANGILEEE